VAPEQPSRPPKSPPRSPLIEFPSIDKLPEQQPPAPPKKPEIIRFPDRIKRTLQPDWCDALLLDELGSGEEGRGTHVDVVIVGTWLT